MRLTTFVLVLAISVGGCAAFVAGWRAPQVLGIKNGMTPGGVLGLAGEPQRREQIDVAGGMIEVWYYVIAYYGDWEERPIVFRNGQVIAVGDEGRATITKLRTVKAELDRLEAQPAQ